MLGFIDLKAKTGFTSFFWKRGTLRRTCACSGLVRRLYLATASMCGDRSRPKISASGKVDCSFSVLRPVEQPMSTIVLGCAERGESGNAGVQ